VGEAQSTSAGPGLRIEELRLSLDAFRGGEFELRQLEQYRAMAKLNIRLWALEFEKQTGHAPSTSDKRVVLDKYMTFYEVLNFHFVAFLALCLSLPALLSTLVRLRECITCIRRCNRFLCVPV